MSCCDHASVCAGALVNGALNESNDNALFHANTPACDGCMLNVSVIADEGDCVPIGQASVFDTTFAAGDDAINVTLAGNVALTTTPVWVKTDVLLTLIVMVMGSGKGDNAGACKANAVL